MESDIRAYAIIKSDTIYFQSDTINSKIIRRLIDEQDTSAVTSVHFYQTVIVGESLDLSFRDIGFSLIMEKCQFHVKTELMSSNVKGELSFRKSHFHNTLDLSQLKVFGNLWLQEAIFERDIILSMLQTDGTLQAQSSTYNGGTVNWSELKIKGGNIFLAKARFNSEKNKVYIGGQAKELLATETVFNTPTTIRLHVVNDMKFNGADFLRKVTLDGSRIGGSLKLENLKIDSVLSLKYTETMGLIISNVHFSQKSKIEVPGLSFKYFTLNGITDTTRNSTGNLKKGINHLSNSITYSRSFYSQLENFYSSQGNSAIADWIYIKQRRLYREMQPILSADRLFGYLIDFFTGYGRAQWRLGIIGSLLLMLGMIVFRNENKMISVDKDTGSSYNAFWYSLDLLLPAIDLRMAKFWIPGTYKGQVYMRCQILAGWILIPLALAGFLGLIN